MNSRNFAVCIGLLLTTWAVESAHAGEGKATESKATESKATESKATESKATESKAIQLAPDSVPNTSSSSGGVSGNIVGFFEGFRDATSDSRKARCKTALCWGGSGGTEFALEPLAELPVGKSVSFDNSGLGSFVNSHSLSLSLAAGMRVWVLEDMLSIGVYFSQPLFVGEDRVRVAGVATEFPTSAIRRPYPGIAIGLLGDTFWIGFDVEQLRNGSGTNRDLNFAPNAIIANSATFTIAIAPFNTFRSGLGTINAKKEREDAEKKEK